jgi:ribosomal protein L12E/L44/L45/RPP1/RPP2
VANGWEVVGGGETGGKPLVYPEGVLVGREAAVGAVAVPPAGVEEEEEGEEEEDEEEDGEEEEEEDEEEDEDEEGEESE